MWEKIKSFFSNKITKLVSWIVLALAVVSLILGGATQEVIASGVALVIGIIAAVAAFIVFLCEQTE